MAKSNTFETGQAPGTTITTANSAAPDAFDDTTVITGGTLTYETEPSGAGGLAGKCVTGVTSGSTRVGWNTGLGAQTTTFGRGYFWFPTAAPVSIRCLGVHPTAGGPWPGTQIAALNISASSVPRWNINGTLSGTTGTALSADTLYRIEYNVVVDTVNGSAEARIYLGESINVSQTLIASAVNTGSTGLDQAMFGVVGSSVSKEVWVDNVLAGATDWPGPAGSPISNEPIAIPQTHPEFGPF